MYERGMYPRTTKIGYKYYTLGELQRIAKLDLSDAIPKTDLMYCPTCDVQYPCGSCGRTECRNCGSHMRYVRFDNEKEINEWRSYQMYTGAHTNS